MSAATSDPTGIPIPANKTYLSHRQAEELKGEITSLEATIRDPASRLEDRSEVARQLRKLQADLETERPPDTTPDQRTALDKEERRLREEIIASMCSQEEMRKAPPGAVGKYRRGEASPEMKAKILHWKNIRRIQHKGDDDPDISNIEMYRHTNSTLNMQNAQIPGKDHFLPPGSPQYQANWERTFGDGKEADTAEVDALKARLAELEALVKSNGAAKRPARQLEMIDCAYCGRPCKGNVGRIAHERQCKSRPTPAAQGDTT